MPTNYKDAKEATLKSPNIAEGCLFGVVASYMYTALPKIGTRFFYQFLVILVFFYQSTHT